MTGDFVVRAHQIKAFDLKTGDVIWTSPRDLVSVGQQVSGLGVFGRFDYFLPTNEVIRCLFLAARFEIGETQYPLGNLLAVDGDVISQGPRRYPLPLVREFGARGRETPCAGH